MADSESSSDKTFRFLADENFNGDVIRGLLRREPNLDLVRAQDVGLLATDDPTVLEWAASEERILLTHDRQTVPKHAYARLSAGQEMTGVFVVDDQLPIGKAIDEILVVLKCSEASEWNGLVTFLPM